MTGQVEMGPGSRPARGCRSAPWIGSPARPVFYEAARRVILEAGIQVNLSVPEVLQRHRPARLLSALRVARVQTELS
jgi:hypothetical protein